MCSTDGSVASASQMGITSQSRGRKREERAKSVTVPIQVHGEWIRLELAIVFRR